MADVFVYTNTWLCISQVFLFLVLISIFGQPYLDLEQST